VYIHASIIVFEIESLMQLPVELQKALQQPRWVLFFKENALLHSEDRNVTSEEMDLKLGSIRLGLKRLRGWS
jgi:hypothetical protein